MAERLVSPGVFTQEKDLSFLPQGIAEIGAAFVGPFVKGPAFRPVIVESQDEFAKVFGGTSTDLYAPYAVQSYLKEAARATVVRILGLDGYSPTAAKSVVLKLGSTVLGVLHPSRTGITIASSSLAGTPTNFSLTISGSSGVKTFTSMSADPLSTNYFVNVLGSDATSKQDAYVYAQFPAAASSASLAATITATAATTELNFSGSVFGAYSNASTPWIRSQTIGGSKLNLFKFHTLSDGDAANKDIKVSLVSIRPAQVAGEYGTFGVLVRAFDDTDNKTTVLEQFDGLTLDPTSPNFIGKKIGTARTVIDANGDIYLEGDFANQSKYIYAELAEDIDALPASALPYGFAPLSAPVNSAGVPAPSYVSTRYFTPAGSSVAIANPKTYYGFSTTDETGLSYLKGLPSGSATVTGVGDVGFDLLTTLAVNDITDITPTTAANIRRFTVPFQGGFDGQNPAAVRSTGASITNSNTQGFDLSDSTKAGARAYKMALDALSNPDAFDINLLVLPGVVYSQHAYVITEAITVCENRGDCFMIADGDVLGATVTSAVNAVADLDTSYAATYHPWVKIRDNNSNKTVWVPPSVVMPAVFAANDRVAAEWFAPAGLNRGGVSEALQVRSRLDQSNRDQLYEGRVNPVATFPAQGICVWGQKTLQQAASALDRINVRRLLIKVKKFIASSSRYLVFEQNTEATRNRFLSVVNPYLANVQERSGLYAFKVIMDDSNNTSDLIDRNILVGQIYLQPTRSVEFITLDFNILPTGAVFPN